MDKMRRMSIVGLSLMAMIAFGAMSASPAVAGEYGVCLKVAKTKIQYTSKGKLKKTSIYEGGWKTSTCTVPAPVNKYFTKGEKPENETELGKVYDGPEGAYEWYPGLSGIGHDGVTAADFEFTSTSKKADVTSRAGEVSCKASTGVGRILGTQLNAEETRYTECTLSVTKGKCTSTGIAGLQAGEIVVISTTFLLDHGTKGPNGLEPPEGKVWNVFLAKKGSPYYPDQTKYLCEPNILFVSGGNLTGEVTKVDHMSDTFTTTFGEGLGEQSLVTIYSTNGGQSYEQTGPNVATVKGTSTTSDKSKIEVRACNEEPTQTRPVCEHEEALP